LRVKGSGFRIWDVSVLELKGLGSRVEGFKFRFKGSRFRATCVSVPVRMLCGSATKCWVRTVRWVSIQA
jgi:hypothetical protein